MKSLYVPNGVVIGGYSGLRLPTPAHPLHLPLDHRHICSPSLQLYGIRIMAHYQ